MGLGHAIAEELGVRPQHVLLLRHSNTKVDALRRRNIPIHENYTCVQPTDSKYDYLAKGRPPIKIVVVIVQDKVDGAYWVTGIEKEGTTRSLVSEAFAEFDSEVGYPILPARRFKLDNAELPHTFKRPITGWSNPRCSVARYGGSLFDSVCIKDFAVPV